MFPANYFPIRHYTPRYWPPGGVPAGVPVTGDLLEFFLCIQQIGLHNLQLLRTYDNSLQIWQAGDYTFTFDVTDLTPADIDKIQEFYLSIKQTESIELILQRWYELDLPVTKADPTTLTITKVVS